MVKDWACLQLEANLEFLKYLLPLFGAAPLEGVVNAAPLTSKTISVV